MEDKKQSMKNFLKVFLTVNTGIKPLLLIPMSFLLFWSCSFWQNTKPIFPSFSSSGYTYPGTLNGDLTLFQGVGLTVLSSYEQTFINNIEKKISAKLGRPVDLREYLKTLKGNAGIPANSHPNALIQEPTISRAKVARVSSCPLPELDTSSNGLTQRGTLLKAIDWKIFATCLLKNWNLIDLSHDLRKDEERYLFQAYPVIEPTNTYHDAMEFIVMAVLTSLYQNYGAGFNLDEQLGFFERIFLATKLRTLTQKEVVLARQSLAASGLYITLRNYILNWYISNTYFKYFNYSKNPDGRYRVARLWGTLTDAADNPLEGASYRLTNPHISGHVLSGKTGIDRQTRLNRLRMLLPEEDARYTRLTGTSTPNFPYNMELQFYLPLENFRKDAAGSYTSTTITPHPRVSILVEKPGHVSTIQRITLKHRFTHPDFPEPGNVLLAPPPFSLDSIGLDIQRVELERVSGGLVSLTGFPAKMEFQANNADLRQLFGKKSIPKNYFKKIHIDLGQNSSQTYQIGDNIYSKNLGYDSPQNTLILEGNFHLRGGMVTELVMEGQTKKEKSLLPLLIWSDSDSEFRLADRIAIQSIKSLDAVHETHLKAALGNELEEMIEEADLIVQGQTLPNPDTRIDDTHYGGQHIYTFYTIQGNVPVKGKLSQEALAKYKKQHKRDFDYNNFTLQIIGGKIPNSDIEIIATHMPKLTPGKDTILFLKEYTDKLGVLQGDRGQVDLQ